MQRPRSPSSRSPGLTSRERIRQCLGVLASLHGMDTAPGSAHGGVRRRRAHRAQRATHSILRSSDHRPPPRGASANPSGTNQKSSVLRSNSSALADGSARDASDLVIEDRSLRGGLAGPLVAMVVECLPGPGGWCRDRVDALGEPVGEVGVEAAEDGPPVLCRQRTTGGS